MPIVVLPEDVAAKIAAGEVIERPVSVVKELVENALDAGATDIRVEIREGGQRLLRVADNGCGIPAEDVPTAFHRHATSKLRSADDLFNVTTLGFRGEALPSIAAVSRVTVVTRTREEVAGTRVRLDGGHIVERASVGAPAGTVITVENLFYNTPARLKFLKSATAEAGQIQTLINHFALAYPDRRFSLLSEGRQTFQHTGGALLDGLTAVYGAEIARQMIEVSSADAGDDLHALPDGQERVAPPPGAPLSPSTTWLAGTDFRAGPRVYGYISPPAVSRANRVAMSFIVNGRWVQDRSLAVAVTEAYHTLLMTGRYPVTTLHISLPPEDVDVNVHPTKAEVRFRDGRVVFAAVQQLVRRALLRHAPIPQYGQYGSAPAWDTAAPAWNESRQDPLAWRDFDDPPAEHETLQHTDIYRPAKFAPPALAPTGRLPMLRVLGQVSQMYIIAEGPDGLYLIDQHAAHERVLFEQFLAAHARAEVAAQPLLDPLPLDLTGNEPATLAEHAEGLARLGFTLEPFGPNTVLVRAVPAALRISDPRDALRDILAQLGEGRRNPIDVDTEAALLRAVCKTAAIKAGQTLSPAEMGALVRQLEATTSPRTCPHGRPTMIHLTAAQLEREFGRK